MLKEISQAGYVSVYYGRIHACGKTKGVARIRFKNKTKIKNLRNLPDFYVKPCSIGMMNGNYDPFIPYYISRRPDLTALSKVMDEFGGKPFEHFADEKAIGPEAFILHGVICTREEFCEACGVDEQGKFIPEVTETDNVTANA